MKKINTAFIAFFIVFSVNAQMAVFKKELVKPTQLTYYGLNHLGDTSSIVSNEIAKETVLNTFTFKDPFLGNITQYDERNPFQQFMPTPYSVLLRSCFLAYRLLFGGLQQKS